MTEKANSSNNILYNTCLIFIVYAIKSFRQPYHSCFEMVERLSKDSLSQRIETSNQVDNVKDHNHGVRLLRTMVVI